MAIRQCSNMVIQGHDSKYDMMTLFYVCTTADMDERTLHKANMDRPTWCDTTFEDYLMTVGHNLTHWKMEARIYSTNDPQHLYWYSTVTRSMLDNVLIIYVMIDGNLYLESLFTQLVITLMDEQTMRGFSTQWLLWPHIPIVLWGHY